MSPNEHLIDRLTALKKLNNWRGYDNEAGLVQQAIDAITEKDRQIEANEECIKAQGAIINSLRDRIHELRQEFNAL